MNKLIPFINADTGGSNPIHRDFAPDVKVRDVSKDLPNGGGSGCGNVTGYLDSWGTMTLPNSFAESIEFLDESGFLCDGHGRATNGYTENSDLGLFTKVFEDAEGLQIAWAYHPKPHSQDARTTLQHRKDNNKKSGLSIGFFVGDGRTAPVGWTYDPDEDKPDGIDYIEVRAQHFEEVLLEVSKPEYLKDNLARAANLNCIYLFCNVHVFEVSQTLVPANEVSLIAEVRTNSKPNTKKTMATTRAKREDDDDDDSRGDAVQRLRRAHRDLTNEHKEHDKCVREKLDAIGKQLSKLDSSKADDDDDDEPEEKPEKKKPEKDPEEKSRARKLFNGGKE
jgi:hypothetical protein